MPERSDEPEASATGGDCQGQESSWLVVKRDFIELRVDQGANSFYHEPTVFNN
jgi:hypothetical protein